MARSIKYARTFSLPFGIPTPALNFLECHFEFVPPADQADVFACLFVRKPVRAWKSYEGLTRIIDLTSDVDRLFAALPKRTRYEINRANKRDGVETSFISDPTEAHLDRFMDYYDDFAFSKGLPMINRPQLTAWRSTKALALSTARSPDGDTLACHAHLTNHARARLTHSASLFRLERDSTARAQIGRANRLLHWTDLTSFQGLGASRYDLGGWYEGSHNEALLKINAFKKEFGGEVVAEWSSFRAGSRLGSLYLTSRDWMLRRKR
jgi:hypothetical protein